mmetsp:Transcript_106778/g.195998  ORF Transcript_106778/g.195998 Transcript_106778/m.195998 type:complete len:357 (+) Transcript_106778:116-1186(+)
MAEQDFGPAATLSQFQKPDKAESTGLCCGLFKRKKKAAFQQTLVLLRHSERQDYVDKTYKESEEGKKWPHDAPLTAVGWALAKEHAEELAELHSTAQFAAVSTSPYRRCMETAAVVAARLKLPLIIDQEMGEIWEKKMGDEKLPWRSSVELRKMAKDLKVKKLANPVQEDGSLKLFGKLPSFPESLDKGRKRYLVRTEHYIHRSSQLKQNFILVCHADAVAACLEMFERGCADISKMEFCARIIAKNLSSIGDEPASPTDLQASSSYAKKWEVQLKGITVTEFTPSKSMAKYQETMHMESCEDVQKQSVQRNEKRTKTDMMFDDKLKGLLSEMEYDDDDCWDAEEENHQTHSAAPK